MAKVTIINVDIGDINEIVSENITRFSAEARKVMAEAIQTQKRIRDEKERRKIEKQEQSDQATGIMKEIHDKIEQAIPNGVPVDEIMEMAKDTIPTTSALTLRIKTMLRKHGHKYRLVKKKKAGIFRYHFEPFSNENDEE